MRKAYPLAVALVAAVLLAPLLARCESTRAQYVKKIAPYFSARRVYRVVQSAMTVKDSVVACAIYRTDRLEVGLLAPALVARRTSPDSVMISYDEDVRGRCTNLVESRGFRITLPETPHVMQWHYEPGHRRLPRHSGLRA